MKVETSQHARTRLKQRFNNCPCFGGKLQDKELKFVENLKRKNDASIYKYKWCHHPMYLLITNDYKKIITIMTPKMYYTWKTRWILRIGLHKFFQILGFTKYQSLGWIIKTVNFMLPRVEL